MSAKHTAGPWRVLHECADPEWCVVVALGGRIVANVNAETGPDIPPLVSTKMPKEGNALLIAAAPELAAALLALVGPNAATSLCIHKPKDSLGRVMGTWNSPIWMPRIRWATASVWGGVKGWMVRVVCIF